MDPALNPYAPGAGTRLPRRGQDATCNRLDLLAVPTSLHVRAAGCTFRPDPCASSSVRTVAPVRASLISKGMIYSPAHGDTGFTVPLFDQYLRRRM